MSKSIVVISVHPDDETIGAGGTLLKHISQGEDVYCIHVTDGNEHQKKYISEINKLYGFKASISLGLPELILDDMSLNEIIPELSRVFKEIKPEILYIPNRSDAHSDHRKIFDALIACTKAFRYPFIKKILMMEVQSETDFSPILAENAFLPNVFSDISKHYDKKEEILKVFESELFGDPFTRSISSLKAQARYRGSMINATYAEAFMLLKEIV